MGCECTLKKRTKNLIKSNLKLNVLLYITTLVLLGTYTPTHHIDTHLEVLNDLKVNRAYKNAGCL